MTVSTPIPHSRPWLTEADYEAVERVLRSERLATGETRAAFERAVADWLRVPEPGLAVSSGRSALYLALRALGVGDGDDVVIPTYACTSLQAAVAATGARAIPCDAGPQWLMTTDTVAPCLTPRTRAIVVVHLYGYLAPTSRFRRFGVPLVEDFAQAFPAPTARTLEADLGVCSFHPTKCLTTGEGGMVLSASHDLMTRARGAMLAPMSDLAAALGLSQLARYPAALRRRRDIAECYRRMLETVCPDVLVRQPRGMSVDFRFPVSVAGGVDLCARLFAARGITVRRGVDHLVHRELGRSDADFPEAVELMASTVSLPIYPALSDDDVQRCLDAAVDIFAAPLTDVNPLVA